MDFTFHNGTNGSAPWVEFYPYTPSATAGYAFMVIFGVTIIIHFVLIFPYRAAYFIPLIIGGICETFGYYGRALSHQDRTAIGPWALQEILNLCAPPFIAATIYMLLGRIIRSFDAEHLSIIRTKWLTTIFVINDIICFLTQIAGAGVQVTGSPGVMAIGVKAVLAGLVFSLIIFGVFVVVAVRFHRRLDEAPTAVVMRTPNLNWKRYMWVLYIACLMLMLRNLVRVIQFGSNKESALNTEEAFIYVFDAALMFVTVGVLIVLHPGRLIKRVRLHESMGEEMDSVDVPLTGHGRC